MVEAVTKPRPRSVGVSDGVPTVYVYRDVLDEIHFNGGWREDRFAAGLLIGQHYQDPDDGQTYVEVEGFLSGTHVEQLTDLTRYLRLEWKAATAAQRQHFPTGELLGWYLAGVTEDGRKSRYLDQEILLLHHTFFAHPWQPLLWLEKSGPARAVLIEGDVLTASPAMVIDTHLMEGL